jgi:hypothetical protein
MRVLIDTRLGDLSDKELENLHGNAIRLAQSGTGSQQAEAERLLPLIGAEIERRARLRASALVEERQTKRQAMSEARKRRRRASES